MVGITGHRRLTPSELETLRYNLDLKPDRQSALEYVKTQALPHLIGHGEPRPNFRQSEQLRFLLDSMTFLPMVHLMRVWYGAGRAYSDRKLSVEEREPWNELNLEEKRALYRGDGRVGSGMQWLFVRGQPPYPGMLQFRKPEYKMDIPEAQDQLDRFVAGTLTTWQLVQYHRGIVCNHPWLNATEMFFKNKVRQDIFPDDGRPIGDDQVVLAEYVYGLNPEPFDEALVERRRRTYIPIQLAPI